MLGVYSYVAVREDRMPGGRHRHKSQTQDIKDKSKKRRPSKESGYITSPCSSCGDATSPRLSSDEVDITGMLSKYILCRYMRTKIEAWSGRKV